MKKLNAILILTALVACCFSCKKDPQDFDVGQIGITEKDLRFVKENEVVSAELLAACSYTGTIRKVAVRVGFSEDLSDARTVDATNAGDDFLASFPVMMDTVYYYQYVLYRYSIEFDQETEWVDNKVYMLSTYGVRLPSVTTNDVKFISHTHALGCGTVLDDDGDEMVERGFCWDFGSLPKIEDGSVSEGIGIGDYYAQISGLEVNTKYYLRAYAKNSQGIVYGNIVSFMTLSEGQISVETRDPLAITENSVKLKGGVTLRNCGLDDYGFLFGDTPLTEIVLKKNFHWGNSNFTILPDEIVENLDYGATYYFRTYAVDLSTSNTVYGEMKSFTTGLSPFIPTGELDGLFSVSPTQRVMFSSGNLQYQALSNKWRFALNQWDFIGPNNKYISSSYYGWIDMFGWGTSGNNHGAVCYQPWSTSYSYSDYYAYGGYEYNLNDQTGQADWGCNTIYLGSNATDGWRTLTSDEWSWLLFSRDTPSGIRFAKAQLNIGNGTDNTHVNGIIVFPDDWNGNDLIYQPNTPEASYTSNVVYVSDWKDRFESHGAVFLPAAGRRSGSYYYDDGQLRGYYWSASKYDYRVVSHLYFSENEFGVNYLSLRYYGNSVRLVRNSK